jgi:hypothetical protein
MALLEIAQANLTWPWEPNARTTGLFLTPGDPNGAKMAFSNFVLMDLVTKILPRELVLSTSMLLGQLWTKRTSNQMKLPQPRIE